MSRPSDTAPDEGGTTRRGLLRSLTLGGLAAAGASCTPGVELLDLLQKSFRELSRDQVDATLRRLEERYTREWGRQAKVDATGPIDGVVYGYGLDVSHCIGCRRCVYACVAENNTSRDPEIQWIRVLEFERERVVNGFDLSEGNAYYDHEQVPAPDKVYLPVACQHCDDPPCTTVCPTGATWKEPDGIVAIDYDWCIGCRYCIAACPYGARHFNWAEPTLAPEDANPDMHLLGNRPRPKGVVEKCTFCIQRVRDGRYPACVEVCPTGARKFGNLLDPNSEIRYLLAHKRSFVLKAELETHPKFFYFW